jgi:hypothetical protein
MSVRRANRIFIERRYNLDMRHAFSSARTAALAVIALSALFLVALEGAAAAKPKMGPRSLQQRTPGLVESLAMDGSRIAYDVAGNYGSPTRCNEVHVWNVPGNVTRRVSGRQTCGADNSSTGAGVRELALAGGRVAWIVNQGGNSESGDHLYVSSVAGPHERVLASAFRTGSVDGILTGNWLGGLVGSQSFLGVDHWATDTNGAVTKARLQSVGARLGDLAEGTGAMLAQSTDGRLIAVLRSDGSVGLYSTGGALLRTVTPHLATDVAVRGDFLAVLTDDDTLVIYNSHSGRRLRSWRVAHKASSLDLSNGIATYAAPLPGGGYSRVVHVRWLKSGRDRVLVTTPPALFGVQFEPAGLAYAFNRITPGRPGAVVFVPMSRVVLTLRAR